MNDVAKSGKSEYLREYMREYMRNWRKNNPGKNKEIQERYWEKKATEMGLKSVSEESVPMEKSEAELIADAYGKLIGEYALLLAERDRYKAALEWYANKKNWQLGVMITMGSAHPQHEPIKSDKGERARKALEGAEPNDH